MAHFNQSRPTILALRCFSGSRRECLLGYEGLKRSYFKSEKQTHTSGVSSTAHVPGVCGQALSQKQSTELGELKTELSGLKKDLEDERLGREQGGEKLKKVSEAHAREL